jgi:hypothetical protein
MVKPQYSPFPLLLNPPDTETTLSVSSWLEPASQVFVFCLGHTERHLSPRGNHTQAQFMENQGVKPNQAALTHLIRGFAKERDVNAAMVSRSDTYASIFLIGQGRIASCLG